MITHLTFHQIMVTHLTFDICVFIRLCFKSDLTFYQIMDSVDLTQASQVVCQDTSMPLA